MKPLRPALAASLASAIAFAAAAAAPEPVANPHAAASPHAAAVAAAPVGKIAKATEPDARTVSEILGGKSALKDKTVTIRGQVVKVTSGVLGKSWLHLQDGSGSAADRTNDLVVTTRGDAPAVGTVVKASGKVRTDVDIGSGYVFPVLVDDAKIAK